MKPLPIKTSTAYRGAFQLALIYGLFAALWILFSDTAVEAMFSDPGRILQASVIKGWLFVVVTSALLFVHMRRLLDRLLATNAQHNQLQSDRLRALQLVESIAECSNDAIFAKDLKGHYILFNRAASAFVGKHRDEVIGRDDRAIFPPEQADMLIEAGRRILERGSTMTREERLSTPAGERIFLSTKGPLHDAAGKIIGLFGIARDITERHLAEEKLRDREEKLSAIIHYSPSALSLKTPDGRYALANPNLQRILKRSEAEIIGRTDFELFPEATARIFATNDERVRQQRERYSVEESVPVDDELRTYMAHIFPILGEAGELRFICRIALDITASKAAEVEAKRLADDLTATLHAIPDLLFEIDATGHYVRIQSKAKALAGAPAAQRVGHRVEEDLPPEAAGIVMAALAQASRDGTDYGRTIALPLADGIHQFELSVAQKATQDAAQQHFIVLLRDVTARQAAEQQLRHNNEELERFNTASVGREMQMIALKRQINDLSRQLGRAAPFDLTTIDPLDKRPTP